MHADAHTHNHPLSSLVNKNGWVCSAPCLPWCSLSWLPGLRSELLNEAAPRVGVGTRTDSRTRAHVNTFTQTLRWREKKRKTVRSAVVFCCIVESVETVHPPCCHVIWDKRSTSSFPWSLFEAILFLFFFTFHLLKTEHPASDFMLSMPSCIRHTQKWQPFSKRKNHNIGFWIGLHCREDVTIRCWCHWSGATLPQMIPIFRSFAKREIYNIYSYLPPGTVSSITVIGCRGILSVLLFVDWFVTVKRLIESKRSLLWRSWSVPCNYIVSVCISLFVFLILFSCDSPFFTFPFVIFYL